MDDPRHRGDPTPMGGNDNVVEAGQDPETLQIEHLNHEASEDANFAKQEAGFAALEHQYSHLLRQDGRGDEADFYEQDAGQRMGDAQRVMREAVQEANAADDLRDVKKQKLALELQHMPSQHLSTLRSAVVEIRQFVQTMSPADKLKVGLAANLREERIEELQHAVVETGLRIERVTATVEGVRTNPHQVIMDLVAFTAAVMTIADHLPALMELVQRFGQMLLRFHIA